MKVLICAGKKVPVYLLTRQYFIMQLNLRRTLVRSKQRAAVYCVGF